MHPGLGRGGLHIQRNGITGPSLAACYILFIYLSTKAMWLRCDCINQIPLCTSTVGNGVDLLRQCCHEDNTAQ